MRLILIMSIFLTGSEALAGTAYPVIKAGSCPAGYRESGGYCAPTGANAGNVMPKPPGKQCPSGYAQSGAYCQELRR